jgi:hypothetical protein
LLFFPRATGLALNVILVRFFQLLLSFLLQFGFGLLNPRQAAVRMGQFIR